MGKLKTRRQARPKVEEPTGLPSVKSDEEEEAETLSIPLKPSAQNTLPGLIHELTEGDEEAKISALLGIGCLENVVLSKEALRTIAPMMVDPSTTIQVAAANALRMLVMGGGAKVANEMVDDDIMTPLDALFDKIYPEVFTAKGLAEDEINKEVLASAIKLLWTLTENSESALKFASRPKVMNILVACAECDDNKLALAAVQCLQTTSEDNTSVITQLSSRQDHMLAVLTKDIDQPETMQLQTLFASLLVNIHNGLMSRVLPATLMTVVSTLSQCLEKDALAMLEAACPISQSGEMDADSDKGEDEEEEDEEKKVDEDKKVDESQQRDKNGYKQSYVKDIENAGIVIDAQVCALETLANICTNDDDDEGMEVSESSEDGFSESELDEELSSNFQSLSIPQALPSEVHESMLQNKVLALTLEKAKQPPPDLLTSAGPFAEEEDIPKRLRKLQTRALLCLHNLVRGLSLEALGGPQQLHETWKALALKIVTEWHNDAELLEASTSTLRALTSRLAEEKSGVSLVQAVSPTDLDTLCRLAEQCKDVSVRINIYRVLASLSAICSENFTEKTSSLILTSGRFLLDQSSKESDLVGAAEALDALMDALSEDCTDATCTEIQLVPRLQSLVPVLQHKIRGQKKQMLGSIPIVKTVKANLARFIKYKANRLK